MGQFFIDR